MEPNGIERNISQRNGVEWNRMERWNGRGWKGAEQSILVISIRFAMGTRPFASVRFLGVCLLVSVCVKLPAAKRVVDWATTPADG